MNANYSMSGLLEEARDTLKTEYDLLDAQYPCDYIAEVADVLVIISPDYEEYLRIGAGETMLKIKTIFNGNELLQYIKELEKTDSLILFANKLFSNVDYYLRTKDNIKLVP